jgi:transaldolase
MKIFLDTADIEEIRRRRAGASSMGSRRTRPLRQGRRLVRRDPRRGLQADPGPVSAEVVSDDVEGMLEEGRHFAKLAPNIVVKVAMSENGLEAISRFAEEGIKTNCTLIFTPTRACWRRRPGAA